MANLRKIGDDAILEIWNNQGNMISNWEDPFKLLKDYNLPPKHEGGLLIKTLPLVRS